MASWFLFTKRDFEQLRLPGQQDQGERVLKPGAPREKKPSAGDDQDEQPESRA